MAKISGYSNVGIVSPVLENKLLNKIKEFITTYDAAFKKNGDVKFKHARQAVEALQREVIAILNEQKAPVSEDN